jgi:hypothetical protein
MLPIHFGTGTSTRGLIWWKSLAVLGDVVFAIDPSKIEANGGLARDNMRRQRASP